MCMCMCMLHVYMYTCIHVHAHPPGAQAVDTAFAACCCCRPPANGTTTSSLRGDGPTLAGSGGGGLSRLAPASSSVCTTTVDPRPSVRVMQSAAARADASFCPCRSHGDQAAWWRPKRASAPDICLDRHSSASKYPLHYASQRAPGSQPNLATVGTACSGSHVHDCRPPKPRPASNYRGGGDRRARRRRRGMRLRARRGSAPAAS